MMLTREFHSTCQTPWRRCGQMHPTAAIRPAADHGHSVKLMGFLQQLTELGKSGRSLRSGLAWCPCARSPAPCPSMRPAFSSHRPGIEVHRDHSASSPPDLGEPTQPMELTVSRWRMGESSSRRAKRASSAGDLPLFRVHVFPAMAFIWPCPFHRLRGCAIRSRVRQCSRKFFQIVIGLLQSLHPRMP